MPLDPIQRRALLGLGLHSIEQGLHAGRYEQWSGEVPVPGLDAVRACFTTLRMHGELRGCCGSIEPTRALAADVWRNAWVSAFRDPRFVPLESAEFASLTLEISVLGPLEPIAAGSERELVDRLRPGVDGLVLAAELGRATFLPAVWEQLPEPESFVRALALKAGWPAGQWPRAVTAHRYATESFGT
jgi:AmmeMemoRadiSam system protein A